jgi:hypothetical protein
MSKYAGNKWHEVRENDVMSVRPHRPALEVVVVPRVGARGGGRVLEPIVADARASPKYNYKLT